MKQEFSAFRHLVKLAANLNLAYAVTFVALLGVAIVFGGIAYEQTAQHHLLLNGGLAALDAYRTLVASHQLTFFAFMADSVTGRCYAISAFVQGLGFWVLFVLTPLVACVLFLARLAARRYAAPAAAALWEVMRDSQWERT